MKTAIIFLLSTILSLSGSGQQVVSTPKKDCKLFIIYLVRHAEKDLTGNNGGDPQLSECGEQRAKKLSLLLSKVHLDAVYSTNYIRTKSTALPTANSKGLDILQYGEQDLESFSNLLIDRKQDALVVGHSNTTAELAGLLVGEELGGIDLDIYNRVYQVVVYKKSGRLHLFHTSFECSN